MSGLRSSKDNFYNKISDLLKLAKKNIIQSTKKDHKN